MGFLQDLQFALRVLWKKKGFTLVVILTLGLGIGANSAMFSIIHAILLRPLDVPDVDRLAVVQESSPQRKWDDELSPRAYLDLQSDTRAFAKLCGYQWWEASLTGDGEPEQVLSFLVSEGFFQMLGVQPELGRWFSSDEVDGKTENVVILSHRLWARRYASDRGIVGRAVQFNDKSYTVVGVMPDKVLFPVPAEMWAPLTLSAAERVDRRSRYIGVIGRLRPGATLADADAEIRGMGARMAEVYPATNTGSKLRVVSAVRGITGELTLGFGLTLMGAALFVLLIACANVANVFLAHAMARGRELAVRTALGAGRGRIVRQLLTESALLGLLGSTLSLFIAGWTVDLIKGSMSPRTTRFIAGWTQMGVDPWALALTLAVGVGVGLLFGVMPALHASDIDLNAVLKDEGRVAGGGRATHRLRSALVIAQVSLAMVLLVGAGALVSAFVRMANPNRGFDAGHLLTVRTLLNEARYPKAPDMLAFERRALEQVAALPGVEGAAVVSAVPFGQLGGRRTPVAEGRQLRPEEEVGFDVRSMTAGYLQLLHVPLLEGRHLVPIDAQATAAPQAVISASAARRLWPGESALGKRFRWNGDDDGKPWLTVAGVVGDVQHRSTAIEPTPTIYLLREQSPTRAFYLVARTSGDPTSVAKAISAAVYQLDPKQPLVDMLSLEGVLLQDISGIRLGSSTMAAFALLALLLAAVGIYAVAATLVVQRTHEIGVRMALGAQRRDVLRLVVGKGMFLTVIGLGIGLALAVALVRVMSGMLQEVMDVRAALFVVFAAAVAGVSLLGSYLPARRAANVDPMIALRHD